MVAPDRIVGPYHLRRMRNGHKQPVSKPIRTWFVLGGSLGLKEVIWGMKTTQQPKDLIAQDLEGVRDPHVAI